MADTGQRTVRAARRMTDTEALMWAVEREPAFRSSFLNLTVLDTAPDVDRFRSRMEQAVGAIPRLRQHVVAGNGPMSVPSWADDPDFDIAYHVRRIGAPPPGSDRQLLDMAATIYEDAFDPARPLWQFTIVEGLEGGRAALLAKMHHTITDGVGGVRLSAMFLDLERDAPEPVIPAAEDDADGDGTTGTSILDRLRRPIDLTRRAAGEVFDSMRNPVDTAQSLMRQVLITDRAHSPLWAGKHSLGRHFEVLQVDLDRAKAAAHKLGGTVNDIYLTGVAGGAGAFHRAKGAPVDEMRVSVPISTRTDKSAGGNDFAPTRVLVPVGDDLTPTERFAVIHERLAGVKNERSLGMAETFAGILTSLPSPLLLRLARQQVETVDFACSNVRGAPFDLYVAGAHVEANYPMGPTAGTAFNATLLSYRNSLDVGLCIDSSVVDDPVLLRDCVKESLEELIAAGS